jgi:hypothetical protein
MKTFTKFLREVKYKKTKPINTMIKVVDTPATIEKVIHLPKPKFAWDDSTPGITTADRIIQYCNVLFPKKNMVKPIYVHQHFMDRYNKRDRNVTYDLPLSNLPKTSNEHKNDDYWWDHLSNNKKFKRALVQIVNHSFDITSLEDCEQLYIDEVANKEKPYSPRYFCTVEDLWKDTKYKYQSFVYTYTFEIENKSEIESLNKALYDDWDNNIIADYPPYIRRLHPMMWTMYSPKPKYRTGDQLISDQPGEKNLDKGKMIFKEENQYTLNKLLSESIVNGKRTQLSEEQESYVKDNIEEIKEELNDKFPTKISFLNMSDYREIDETHYFLCGKVHEDLPFVTREEIKKDISYYLSDEINQWYKKGIRHSLMPPELLKEYDLISSCYDGSIRHISVLENIKQQKSLSQLLID